MKRINWFRLLVFLVFLLGVLLRAVEVINGNYLFGFDQGRDYLAAYKIVVERKPTLIGAEVGAGAAGLKGLFHGPFYFYLLSLFFFVFQGDPYGGLVLMFIFGVGALLLTYFLTKRMFGARGALLSTFLVAISPNIVPQSRFLWPHHPTSFFIMIVLYFVYLIPKKPKIYLPLSLFAAGFIYNFQLAIAVPLVISIIVYTGLILRIKGFRLYLLAVFSVIGAFLPFLLFEMRHGFIAVHGLFDYLTKSGESQKALNIFWIKSHLIDYWWNMVSTFRFFSLTGILFFQVLFFLIVGGWSVYYWRKTKKREQGLFIVFLCLTIFLSWMIFLPLRNTVWDYYLIHLHFVYIFLFVFVFLRLLEDKQNFFKQLTILILGGYLLFMNQGALKRLSIDYNYDLFDYGGTAKIQGKLEALDYIYKDAKGEEFGLFVFSPPIYVYPYDYLVRWHGEKVYGYAPNKSKEGLFYLWIEPDPAKSWSHKGWQETVIKTGKVIWEYKLPSGFIIEKRMGGGKVG